MEFMLCEKVKSTELQKYEKDFAEKKYDGRRAFIEKQDGIVRALGRKEGGTQCFQIQDYKVPEVIKAFEKNFPGNFLLDSELVCKDENGNDKFELLLTRANTKDRFKQKLLQKRLPITTIVFDILFLNGKDLRTLPYIERRKILELITPKNTTPLVEHSLVGSPSALWQTAEEQKWEGIIIKNPQGRYKSGRGFDWIKVKRKCSTILKFTGYETSTAGITLISEDVFRCACHGEQHKKVKEKIDNQGYVMVMVEGMEETENGKIRQIVFREMIE